MSDGSLVRPARDEDGPAILAIYREGIATGDATFETEPPGWEEWKRKFPLETALVVEIDRKVAAWAALSSVSPRPVYRGVAEETIYVTTSARGRGIGRRLLEALIERSESDGVWTLQAGIFPENEASLRLHAACGFRAVGTRERIGRAGDRWRDVVLVERRSGIAGT